MDPFIGQIILFGGNFAPRGWAFCDGQLMAISSNTALFSILGTTYGGDGITTFGLPDLRGRVAVGPRTGPGLSEYHLGQRGGQETVTLTSAQLPPHSHTIEYANVEQIPVGTAENVVVHQLTGSSQTQTSSTGGGQPVDIRSPYLALNYIVALYGTYPSRS